MSAKLRRAWLLGLLLYAGAACKRGAKSPEEAFRRLELAVASGSSAGLWDCLDDRTWNAIEGAWKDERLQRSLIEAKYPPKQRAAALVTLSAAASDDVRKYFVKRATEWGSIARYRARLGSVSGPIKQKPDGASAMWLQREDGYPFHFARDARGYWAFDEMLKASTLAQDEAARGVQLVRQRIDELAGAAR